MIKNIEMNSDIISHPGGVLGVVSEVPASILLILNALKFSVDYFQLLIIVLWKSARPLTYRHTIVIVT